MVDNLAEKFDECLLNRGRCVLLTYNWDRENCPLYGVAGCPLFRDCLSIEVNRMAQSELSELSVISWVSAIQGCLSSGILLRRASCWDCSSFCGCVGV